MATSLLLLCVGVARSAPPPPIPLPPEKVETVTQFPPAQTPNTIQPRTYQVTKPAHFPQQGRALPRIDVPSVPPTTTDLPILSRVPVNQQPKKLDRTSKPKDKKTPTEDDESNTDLNPKAEELPATREQIFQLEGDAELIRRIRNELNREQYERDDQKGPYKPDPEAFSPPEETSSGSDLTYVSKTVNYPPRVQYIEPAFVSHRPLYFEEKNSERYGWELGIAQPAISALYFYKDVLFFPAHLASNVRERYDTDRGKCLPGSSVPYYLYPPEISLLGLSAEASAVIATAAFIVP